MEKPSPHPRPHRLPPQRSKSTPHPHGSHSTFLPRIPENRSSTKELDPGKDMFEFPSGLVKRATRPSRV